MFDRLKKTELGVKRSRETWFSKIARVFDRDSIEEGTWDELEELLIMADVGVETAGKLLGKVKQRVKTEKLAQPSQVKATLKEEMVNLLNVVQCSPPSSSPAVILVVGVNGSGKTTSIGKLAYSYVSQNKRVILAAADTFRAAAIEQLQYWGKEVGAQVISHKQGGDPGAVVFDAIQAAYSRQAQVVIVDTAGRLHTKFNLMEELKKIKRVVAKHDTTALHEVLLVVDANTGQNGLTQASAFTQAVGVTDIFLTKLDSTARGGIVFAICDELNIPIAYMGTGEKLADMAPFDAETFVTAILP